MNYQTYKTRKEAKAELEKMAGWAGAKVSQLHLPGDPNANKNGNAFVIEIKQGKGDSLYYRDDGYVR